MTDEEICEHPGILMASTPCYCTDCENFVVYEDGQLNVVDNVLEWHLNNIGGWNERTETTIRSEGEETSRPGNSD